MFHVAFIHSRAALIILALIFLCACALLIRQERKYSSNTLRTTLVYIFLITLIPVSILSAQKSGMKFNIDRFSEIDADWSNAQSNVRYHLIQGTKDMFLDKPLYGWGAGSFVYAFPIYQAKSDFLKNDGQKIDNLYTNAHSDLIQMFAEYGVVGAIILFSAIFYFYFQCWKKRKDLTSVQLMIWLGCIFLIIHSGYEFIFQCPSLLFIFAFMNALLYRSVRYSSNASTDFSNSRKSSS